MTDQPFEFGNPKVNAAGFRCCGKPRGCTMRHEGCAYRNHPWKRAVLDNDPTVRCQKTWLPPGSQEFAQCVLLNGHSGESVSREGGTDGDD